MQRRRTQKVIAMVPPEDSGSSDNDLIEQNKEPEVDLCFYDSSSLSSNADILELDTLLNDFEINPIDQVNKYTFFFFKFEYFIYLYILYQINPDLFFDFDEHEQLSNTLTIADTSDISQIDHAVTSNIKPINEHNSPKPSTSDKYKNKLPVVKRSSKRILNYNLKTPPISSPPSLSSTLSEPEFTFPQHQKTNKIKHMQFAWHNENKFNFEIDVPNYEFHTNITEVLTPYLYFKKFFSDDIFDLIVQETNIYSYQKFGKSINISSADLADFIAIQLWMGVIKLPAYTDYWSKLIGISKIQDIMTIKKYQQFLRSLHFKNNDEYDPNDRFSKIRPFLNLIRRNCLNQDVGNRYSIDEMMVPYKGTKAGSRRQYIKSKPKKWGFKFFIRAGINGQIFDILPYGGGSTFTNIQFSEYEKKYFGLGGKVVLALASTIPKKPLSVVYYDNFFTSPELIYHLRKEYGILSLGTVQQNRLRNCPLLNDKTLKKKGRGSYSAKCDLKKKVMVVKWLDNKSVCLASNYVGVHPISNTRRYNKTTKSRIDVSMPQIVKQYNMHMGGVDLADMLIALYRTQMKTHKWYLNIFSQLLDVCVNNAWLQYRNDCKQLKEKYVLRLKEFRVQIAIALSSKGKPKVGRKDKVTSLSENLKIKNKIVPRPIDDVRLDCYSHMPIVVIKGRCRMCKKGQTTISCSKCNTRLCITSKRNCFLNFHTQK